MRINRLTYESCVLEALRERLRSKEIWVVDANRYRNPDEDLPIDFAEKRTAHYAALGLPLDADSFISGLQEEMRAALHQLNTGLTRNPHMKITARRGGWITLSPLQARPDPDNVEAVKAEVSATWPITSLLDIVKEADLHLNNQFGGDNNVLGGTGQQPDLHPPPPQARPAASPRRRRTDLFDRDRTCVTKRVRMDSFVTRRGSAPAGDRPTPRGPLTFARWRAIAGRRSR